MVAKGVRSFGSTLCTRTKYGATIEEIFGVILVAKHDAKREAKIGANLEGKIDTYLEVKHGAKWNAKVVEKMMQYWMLLLMLTWCY